MLFYIFQVLLLLLLVKYLLLVLHCHILLYIHLYMLFSLLTLLLLLLHLHFLFLLFLLLLLYIHILLYLMSYLFLRACIVNPYIPTSPIMLMFPISGTVSSLYTFIVFAPDLFPASSIAFTVMAYSPSVCTFILVFISSTLF